MIYTIENELRVYTGEAVDYIQGGETLSQLHLQGWCCPACGKKAIECVGRVKKPSSYEVSKYGPNIWYAIFATHHDHSPEWIPDWHVFPRFKATLICVKCNLAEGQLTYRLGLTGKWSFAPDELRHILSKSKMTRDSYQLAKRCVLHTVGAPADAQEFGDYFLKEYQSRFIGHASEGVEPLLPYKRFWEYDWPVLKYVDEYRWRLIRNCGLPENVALSIFRWDNKSSWL